MTVTQIARLVGISRRSALRHQNLSATEVAKQIQHRYSGRPYGKLLPRHAGPIAEFLFSHPKATRDELLDFIAHTWKFRVSKVALWEFLKKYGLDRDSLKEVRQARSHEEELVTIQLVRRPRTRGIGARSARQIFFGRTRYAGAFLLWPQVLSWLDIARDCFTDDYGSLERGF